MVVLPANADTEDTYSRVKPLTLRHDFGPMASAHVSGADHASSRTTTLKVFSA